MIIVDKAEKTTINIPKNSLGNLTYNKPNVDLSDYYTKEQVDELIDNVEVDLSNYYTIEQVNELIANTTISYAIYGYDFDNKIYLVAGDISKVFEDFKQHKPVLIFAPVNDSGKFGVVNCIELDSKEDGYEEDTVVGYVNLFNGDSIIFRRYLFTLSGNIGYTYITKSFDDYYTKTKSDAKYLTKEVGATIDYVDGEIENVKNIIEENELVTAAALTELKQDIPTNISQLTNDSNYATQTWVENNFATNSDVDDEIGKLDSSLTSKINQKQDTLVSGENIKTINGNSLLGSGDIVVEGGGSSNIVELTQAEYDALGDNVDADTLYLISDATISANYKTINGESILGEGNIEISGGTTDLSDYYTKTECDGKFQLKGNYLTSIPSEYVTDTELTNKGYATTTYVDTQIGNINTILENIIG